MANQVILITGIPRSGSTLVYNICRILLSRSSSDLYAYWINDVPLRMQINGTYLLKIHDYDPMIAALPLKIIHTTRDLRAIAASTKAKSGEEPSIEQIKLLQKWDANWKKKSRLVLKYGHLKNLSLSVPELADILEINNYSVDEIIHELQQLSEPRDQEYDHTNQLHQNHRTGAGDRWQTVLSRELIEQVDDLEQKTRGCLKR